MVDFDIDSIREHKISLMDCQIDLILKSLTMYLYVYKYVCPTQKSQSREEDLRVSLVRDTIEQISSIYTVSKKEQKIHTSKEIEEFEKVFEKF